MTDLRLDRETSLRPGKAVAAIVRVNGSYLLQLRDNIPGIFFPAQWGCFGGGVDPGETPEQAIVREMQEELEIDLPQNSYQYFTRFDFDLGFAGLAPIWRIFYEVTLPLSRVDTSVLREGAAKRLFTADEILLGVEPLTPYDAFALWFHINRTRLRA